MEIDARGLHEPTRGALIPARYSLHDHPNYPFICPIRDCRRTLPSLFALGGHFGAAHKFTQVNDNLDGTFTQVGTYKNAVGSSPCMVVSQMPLPLNALPPAEPRLPDTIANALASRAKRLAYGQGGPGAKRQMTDVNTTPTEATGNGGSRPQVPEKAEYSTISPVYSRAAPEASSLDQPHDASSAPAPSVGQNSYSATMAGPALPYSANVSQVPSPQDEPEQALAGRRSIRKSVLARLQADRDVSGSRSSTRSQSAQQEVAQYGQSNQSEQVDYEMEDWEIAPGRVTSRDSLQSK